MGFSSSSSPTNDRFALSCPQNRIVAHRRPSPSGDGGTTPPPASPPSRMGLRSCGHPGRPARDVGGAPASRQERTQRRAGCVGCGARRVGSVPCCGGWCADLARRRTARIRHGSEPSAPSASRVLACAEPGRGIAEPGPAVAIGSTPTALLRRLCASVGTWAAVTRP
jgi:hypothetical protein